jgi:hypothetical protein
MYSSLQCSFKDTFTGPRDEWIVNTGITAQWFVPQVSLSFVWSSTPAKAATPRGRHSSLFERNPSNSSQVPTTPAIACAHGYATLH